LYGILNILDTADGQVFSVPNATNQYAPYANWSPDGRYVVQGVEPGYENYNSVLWDVRAQREIVNLNISSESGLVWSPDSTHLAYATSKRVNVFSVLDNSTHRHDGHDVDDWSPDGRYLSFYRGDNQTGLEGFVLDTRTGEIQPRGGAYPLSASYVWSPDSRYMVYKQSLSPSNSLPTLQALDTSDNSTRTLLDSDLVVYNEAWSTNGYWLAVTASSNPDDPSSSRVVIFDLDTDLRQDFTLGVSDIYYNVPLRWSPDGRYLEIGNYDDIRLYDREDGSLSQLSFDAASSLMGPRWSADGRYLSVSSTVQGHSDIYVYDTVTSQPRNVTSTPNEGEVFFGWRGTGENTSLIYCGEG
jgi:Tol biopolymer transport system component